jgi:hypothetical protein
MSNAMLSLSGAALRALNTPEATAELARRMAKRESAGTVTVAALKSWGRTDEATAIVTHAKEVKAAAKAAKPTPAPVVMPKAPAKVTAFTRTNEVVAAPKSAVAHLHNRMCNLEASVLAMGSLMGSMNETLQILAKAAVAK